MSEKQQTKREFIKKAVYIAPAILTLPAVPMFASSGSGDSGKGHEKHGKKGGKKGGKKK